MLALLPDAVTELFTPSVAPAPPPAAAAPVTAPVTAGAPLSPATADELFGQYADAPVQKEEIAGATAKQLATLSPDKKAEAVAKMDDGALDELAKSTRPEDRAKLDQALDAMTDPEQKLRLWRAMAGEQASRDLAAALEAGDVKLQRAAMQDQVEVQLEAARHLEALKLKKKKNPVTDVMVDKLVERKALERKLQLEHRVSLENTFGKIGALDEYAAWSVDALKQADATLDRMPKDALEKGEVNVLRMRSIERELDDHGAIVDDPAVLGATDAKRGEVNLYAKALTQNVHGRAGDRSPLAGTDPRNGAHALELTLAHEIGHAVMANDEGTREKMEKVAGVRLERPESLPLEALRTLGRNGGSTRVGDRVYYINNGRLASMPAGNIPSGGAHNGGHERDAEDPLFAQNRENPYAYAATSPEEYLAELYTMGVHTPELLHEDYIEDPRRREADARQMVTILERQVELGLASPAELARARDAARRLGEMTGHRYRELRELREQVFELTPDKVEDARARLAGKATSAADKALLAEYDAAAEKAMTPEQLDKLTREYEAKL